MYDELILRSPDPRATRRVSREAPRGPRELDQSGDLARRFAAMATLISSKDIPLNLAAASTASACFCAVASSTRFRSMRCLIAPIYFYAVNGKAVKYCVNSPSIGGSLAHNSHSSSRHTPHMSKMQYGGWMLGKTSRGSEHFCDQVCVFLMFEHPIIFTLLGNYEANGRWQVGEEDPNLLLGCWWVMRKGATQTMLAL